MILPPPIIMEITMISMPTLTPTALATLADWEIELTKSFLDHHNRIQPFWQSRLSFPQQFVYGHLLKRLYQDTRFSVPVTYLNDPFIYPFYQFYESGDWRGFKDQLVYDPVDLIKLIEKLELLVSYDSISRILR